MASYNQGKLAKAFLPAHKIEMLAAAPSSFRLPLWPTVLLVCVYDKRAITPVLKSKSTAPAALTQSLSISMMSTPEHGNGLCLGEKTRWVINGLTEFQPFFRNLARLLPDSVAIIYLEGVSISREVREFLVRHSVPAWHEVFRGTIWPNPSIFHLPATPEVVTGLADLASRYAYPEIADHCHVYTRDEMILQWYDACDLGCPIGVAAIVPEDCVKAFCELAGATYDAYTNG